MAWIRRNLLRSLLVVLLVTGLAGFGPVADRAAAQISPVPPGLGPAHRHHHQNVGIRSYRL